MDASPGSNKALSPGDSSPPQAAAGAGAERAEKEVDDEQVERFYALLANIRALRGAFGTTTTTTPGKRKRAPGRGRGEEPPWRPAFRMEDFKTEEVGSGRRADDAWRSKRNRSCSCERRKPAGTSETGAVVVGNDEDDDASDVVVERSGPRREAPRGCAFTS